MNHYFHGLGAARQFAWSAWISVGVGMALLAFFPGGEAGTPWHPHRAAVVHLFTLGGLLGAFYPLQAQALERLYGRPAAGGGWLSALVLFFHVGGLVTFVAGLLGHSTGLAYLGGHYLVPTGIVLALGQGVATALRRAPGGPAHGAALLPLLGLVVTMSLGALLVMDAHRALYGLYLPPTILVHLLGGFFLFFLPFALLMDALHGSGPGAGRDRSATIRMYPLAAVAGMGVMGVALGLALPGWRPVLPVWLGLLGGVCLWWSVPAGGMPFRGAPAAGSLGARLLRAPWALVGVALLYGAIRDWRGAEPAEAVLLTRVGILVFLLGVALPEMLQRLEGFFAPVVGGGGEGGDGALWRWFLPLWGGAGLLGAGRLGDHPWLVRAGAAAWLVVLAAQGWRWAAQKTANAPGTADGQEQSGKG